MKAISSTWLCFFLIISSSVQGKKPANNNCTVVDTVSFLIYSFRSSDQSGIGLIRLKQTIRNELHAFWFETLCRKFRPKRDTSNAYFNHTSFISDGGGQYLVQLLDVPANQYSLDLIFAQF